MRFKSPGAIGDYFYYCDNCEINDGREVLVWNKKFALCHECIRLLYIQHVSEKDRINEKTIVSRKTITEETRTAVFERDGHKCKKCGSTERLTVDHIIPFAIGGKTIIDNLQTLCRKCNSRKGCRIEKR